MSLFQYPTAEMLNLRVNYTKRELDILQLIVEGLSSEQVAEKLYLSLYTVNTHRGNILKKAKTTRVSDLVIELREIGVL